MTEQTQTQKTDMAPPLLAPWCQAHFDTQQSNLNGLSGGAFSAVRQEAFKKFLELGFPQAHLLEDWKYTSLKEMARTDFSMSSEIEVSSELKKIFKDFTDFDAYHNFCFLNGSFVSELNTEQEIPAGITLCTIREALHSEDKELKKRFEDSIGKVAVTDANALVALNTGLLQDGIYLHVPKDTKLPKPVRILFAASGSKMATVSFPRVLVVMEPGASASVVQEFCSLGTEVTFSNVVSEFIVSDNAKFENTIIQEEGSDRYHFNHVAVQQGATSYFKNATFSFGGKIVRNEIAPTLNGSGSDTHMFGLSVLNGDQHVDNFTVLDHAVPSCESNEQYKGIYDDKSKGVFSGTIIVREDAQKTNAIQSNQGLLLSDTASLSTKPQLKIWADDVKCTHGATVGQIDKDALFYLQSRGIKKREAMGLLIRAFAGDITREVSQEGLRSYLEDAITEKLSQ